MRRLRVALVSLRPSSSAPRFLPSFPAPPRGGSGLESTFGFAAFGFASFGFSRNTTSTFPMLCTGCAASFSQMDSIQVLRASRSSVAARTLTSSWAFSARSTSASTSSVRPLSPMRTMGESLCASARSSLRRFDESGFIAAV